MSTRFVSWLIFIVLCFIWGSSFILMKKSKEGLSAAQIAAVRIFSASIVFIPFAFQYLKTIPRNKILLMVLAGIFGNLLPAFLFAMAIIKMDSSLAGILNSLTPICVVVLGITLFRDQIKTQKIIGVLVGFAGVCLLTLTQQKVSVDNLGYASLIVLATLSYGLNVNIVSHYLKGIGGVRVAAVSLVFMFIPTLIILWKKGFFQLDFSNSVIRDSVLASMVLGIVGSAVATALFYVLVQKAGGLFASLVTYGIPFVALFWGFLDGEKITVIEMLCLGIILAGVYLANRPEKKT